MNHSNMVDTYWGVCVGVKKSTVYFYRFLLPTFFLSKISDEGRN